MRSYALLSALVLAAATAPVLASPTPGNELSNPDFVKRAQGIEASLVKRAKNKKNKKSKKGGNKGKGKNGGGGGGGSGSGGSAGTGGAHTVDIHSANDFCLLLPKPYGGNIADNEDNAIAFCQNPSSSQRAFPSGFIQRATYLSSNRGYVQVTGCINRSAYGLSKNDQGGQLDYNAPAGAQCQGYPYWVEQVEPANNRFCIRCCTNTNDCPQTLDEDGCTDLIPNGVYSYPGVDCSG